MFKTLLFFKPDLFTFFVFNILVHPHIPCLRTIISSHWFTGTPHTFSTTATPLSVVFATSVIVTGRGPGLGVGLGDSNHPPSPSVAVVGPTTLSLGVHVSEFVFSVLYKTELSVFVVAIEEGVVDNLKLAVVSLETASGVVDDDDDDDDDDKPAAARRGT